MNVQEIKKADTDIEIHPLIKKRWSPLSFSDQVIPENQMRSLFEAARWSASSFNEQPWQYVHAMRGTTGFKQLWNCLAEGNQAWTTKAAVLMVAITRTTFSKNGQPNPSASHDLGMANAQMMFQAAHQDIYGHMMAGFSTDEVIKLLRLDATQKPVCMIALGYLGKPEALEGSYQVRETSPRSRKPSSDFATLI